MKLFENDPMFFANNEVFSSDLHTQICIVGAGVCGAALASYLGKNGVQVVIVEKDMRLYERIIGELLQPSGVELLKKLHLEHCLKDIDAQAVSGYRMFDFSEHCPTSSIQIEYPKNEEGFLYQGMGFHHHLFLGRLREEMLSTGNVQLLEGEATDLIEKNNRIQGAKVQLKNSKTIRIHAGLTVVCDGLNSGFRKIYHTEVPEQTGFFLGLLLKNCPLPSPGYGHVFLTSTSPFLCYPISTLESRMLIDFKGLPKRGEAEVLNRFEEIKKVLPACMLSSFEEATQSNYFKVMPNRRLPASVEHKRGMVMLGDALNMRHPLTGGGMTIGLTDVYFLGRKILEYKPNNNQFSNSLYHYIHHVFYNRDHRSNNSINILADALYRVFCDKELAEACLLYLKSSEQRAAEPIKLLSGISRSKYKLYYHFFAVAIYGAIHNIRKKGIFKGITTSAGMIKRAWGIIVSL